MVATRPIKAFEPVVLDQALAFGPCEHTKPRCLACLKLLDEVSTVCPECNLPMCDLEVINVKLAVIVFACWTLAKHSRLKHEKKCKQPSLPQSWKITFFRKKNSNGAASKIPPEM